MPRMYNPRTGATPVDVVPDRAAVLLSRGWRYADGDTAPAETPAATPELFGDADAEPAPAEAAPPVKPASTKKPAAAKSPSR